MPQTLNSVGSVENYEAFQEFRAIKESLHVVLPGFGCLH